MNYFKCFLPLFLLLACCDLVGQNNFSFSIGHSAFNQGIGNSILSLEDGNYLIVGDCYMPSYDSCINVLKMDSLGNVLWHKYYEGLGTFYMRDNILIDKEGAGFIVAAKVAQEGNRWNMGMVKLDSSGDSLWVKAYGGEGIEWTSRMIQLDDGGYILVGYGNSFGDQSEVDGYMVRTDKTGEVIWDKIVTGSKDDRVTGIVQEHSNSFLINIATKNTPSGVFRPLLMRIDSMGNETWSRLYDTDEQHCGLFFKKSHLGGYLFNGCRDFDVTDSKDKFFESMMRGDSLGNFQWTTYFPHFKNKSVANFRELKDGSIIVVGTDRDFASSYYGWIGKIDLNGTVLWEKHYTLEGALGPFLLYDIELAKDGGFVAIGTVNQTIENSNHPQPQIWVLKVDSMGCWQGNCSEDELIVTSPITTSIDAPIDSSSLDVDFFHLYPNPSTNRSNVTFHTAFVSSNRVLLLYDVWGRLVQKIVLQSGQQHLILDAAELGLSDGVYILALKVDGTAIQQEKWGVVKN